MKLKTVIGMANLVLLIICAFAILSFSVESIYRTIYQKKQIEIIQENINVQEKLLEELENGNKR